jgi:hypothetical protein
LKCYHLSTIGVGGLALPDANANELRGGMPLVDKLEGTAAMLVTVITVMTVIAGDPLFDRDEEGRTKGRPRPKKPTPTDTFCRGV